METRSIGSLGVSTVGLGCNNFGRRLDEPGTREVIAAALDAGINFFDTADSYGGSDSEVFLGRILGARRAEVVVASKFGWELDDERRGAHPSYVQRAVEDSLRRLNTDYIDLYQLHKPDPSVPIEDTLGALDELVTAGKVREIGCSNFSSIQLDAADEAARGRSRFVSVQNEYSLLHREPEKEVLGTCERLELAFIPYFPLASGLLTGKYRLGQPPPKGRLTTIASLSEKLNDDALSVVESLIAFAERHGHSILELAFAWLLAKPAVTSVIAGAMSAEQLHQNVRAAEWKMSDDQVAEVDALL
jgi:aryl-alcohol dehydrogenase-like predicted oxidoreductase